MGAWEAVQFGLKKVKDGIKWGIDNAVMPALEKTIPQGASEIGQALFTGNAYVPYGPTDNPVPMQDAAQQTAIEATPAEATAERGGVHGSLKDMIEARADNSRPQQERGMER